MMKRFVFYILLTAAILAAAPLVGTAQNDSPLYQNIISDDTSAPIDTTTSWLQGADKDKHQSQAKDSLPTISSDEEIGEQMRNLQRLYLSGKYNEALQLAQTISEKYHPLDPEDEIDRQKYVIASLKEMEFNEQADSAAKVFLGKNPFYSKYQKKSSDPVPFKEIIDNYYTTPRFSVWVSVGKQLTMPIVDTVHVITDTVHMEPNYEITDNQMVQLGIEYHPWKYLSLSLAAMYTKDEYTRTINRNSTTNGIERTATSIFHYHEESKVIALPLRIEGYWIRKDYQNWVPSLYVGIMPKYVLKSKYNAYTEVPGQPHYQVENKAHNLDDKTRLNVAATFGLKINYNFRRLTFFGDFGMNMDFKPFNNPDAAYSNADLAYDKLYIPDSFKIIEVYALMGFKVNLSYKTIAKYGYGH